MNPWQDLRVLRRSDHTFLRHSRLAGKPKMGHLQQASSFTKGSRVPHVRQASLTLAKKAVQPTPFTEKKNKARRSSSPRLRSSNWTVTEPRLRTQAFRAPNPAPLPPARDAAWPTPRASCTHTRASVYRGAESGQIQSWARLRSALARSVQATCVPYEGNSLYPFQGWIGTRRSDRCLL